jgi:hypothetical protein
MPWWELIAIASGGIIAELAFIEICVVKARNHFGMSPRVMSRRSRQVVVATVVLAVGVALLVWWQAHNLSAPFNLTIAALLGLVALLLLITCRGSFDVYRNALRTDYMQKLKRMREA